MVELNTRAREKRLLEKENIHEQQQQQYTPQHHAGYQQQEQEDPRLSDHMRDTYSGAGMAGTAKPELQ